MKTFDVSLTEEEIRALNSHLIHSSGHAGVDPILDRIQEKLNMAWFVSKKQLNTVEDFQQWATDEEDTTYFR